MRCASYAKVTVRYKQMYMERTMTDNQIAKYLEQIAKHCKAARANPTASTVHIDAIQDLAEHVVKTMKKERPDVTGAPV
jgi:phosphoribosylformylglycinamidine (FGAM) synthase-like amidotransferase family enzyme